MANQHHQKRNPSPAQVDEDVEFIFGALEVFCWPFIAYNVTILVAFLTDNQAILSSINNTKTQYRGDTVPFKVALLSLLALALYGIVFRSMPIQSARRFIFQKVKDWRDKRKLSKLGINGRTLSSEELVKIIGAENNSDLADYVSIHNSQVIEILQQKPQTPHEALALLAQSSRQIADRIYTRAGAFLFIGGVVAIGGVVFSWQTAPSVSEYSDLTTMLVVFGPRIGILFFIELLAFFFLRQHKDAMDEFRYYESVKRQREENLVLFLLASKHWTDLDVEKFLEKHSFRSETTKLAPGESTEVLEGRKLNKDELHLFEQMIQFIGKTK